MALMQRRRMKAPDWRNALPPPSRGKRGLKAFPSYTPPVVAELDLEDLQARPYSRYDSRVGFRLLTGKHRCTSTHASGS